MACATAEPSSMTTFTWDIASGLPVVLDDGNQYVYGAGLAAMKQFGNWYYYLADGLGSTMAMVDSTGVIQKSYQYDVYGEVGAAAGITVVALWAGSASLSLSLAAAGSTLFLWLGAAAAKRSGT